MRIFFIFFVSIDFLLADPTKYAFIKTKKISIPNYSRAYNPSIIEYQNGYLLTFRYITKIPQEFEYSRSEASFVGICKLDFEFNVVVKSVQLLNLITYRDTYSVTAEDARIFNYRNKLFVIFNDQHTDALMKGCRMYIAELTDTGDEFIIKNPAIALTYDQMILTEKNWSPFIFEDRCFLIYSDNPRVILEVDVNSGFCQEVHRSEECLDWNFGQIRGGSPAIRIEDQYLTFFHSSIQDKQNKRRYQMGAYTFNAAYPFSITQLTIDPIQLFDCGKISKEGKFVVFPGGLVIDKEYLHVAWGKNDKEIFISTYAKQRFLESLKNRP